MENIAILDENDLEKFSSLYAGDITANYHQNSICYGYLESDEEDRMVPAALIMSDLDKATLLITWMYVAPEFRDRQIMILLMDRLIQNAIKTRVIKSIYCVSTNVAVPQFLSTQLGFYYDGYQSGKIMSARLESMKDMSNKFKSNNPAKLLRDVDKDALSKLNKYLVADEAVTVGVELPIRAEDYLDCSMAVVDADDIKAIILMSEEGESLSVSYAFAKKGSEHMIMYLVVALQKELVKYPADKKVVAAVVNEDSENLFSRLFTEYSIEPLYECELNI